MATTANLKLSDQWESLRDIEVCLTANQSKLFHMGLSGIPARSTLSDALNQRDWRIYHSLAMRLIERARNIYATEQTGLGIDATAYALDSTTIDLCLSLFDWAADKAPKVKTRATQEFLDLPWAQHGHDGFSDANAIRPTTAK